MLEKPNSACCTKSLRLNIIHFFFTQCLWIQDLISEKEHKFISEKEPRLDKEKDNRRVITSDEARLGMDIQRDFFSIFHYFFYFFLLLSYFINYPILIIKG